MQKQYFMTLLDEKVRHEGYSFFEDCTHEPETIQETIEKVMNDYDISDSESIDADTINDDGKVDEACDSMTPIYTFDRLTWLAQNPTAFDDCMSMVGYDTLKSGIADAAAMAYCYTLNGDVNTVIGKIISIEKDK